MKRRGKSTGSRTAIHNDTRISWGYLILTIFCACVLAAGFFFAALQHFATMDLGFKNSNLRKQVEELEAEKRRLLLAREVVLSPSEIAKTAREYGFVGAEPLPQTELATTARTATTEDPVRMQTAMQLNQPTSSTSAEKADARPRIANVPSSSNSKAAQDKDNKVKPTAATEPKAKRSGSKADSKPQSGAKKQGPEVADGRPRRVSNDKVRKDGGSRGLAGSR